MSRAKAMGTAVETAAVRWFIEHGFPDAERLPLRGSADQGDLRIWRDPLIIVECKRAQRGLQLTPWMRELDAEMTNAGAQLGLLVAKQEGVGGKKVGRWVTAMPYGLFLVLYRLHVANSNSSLIAGSPRETMELEELSPVKVNNMYVPMLTARHRRSRTRPTGWELVPFASTYQRGFPDNRFVVGPLDQFVALLIESGYGKGEGSG